VLFTDVDGFRKDADGALNGAVVFGWPWMGFGKARVVLWMPKMVFLRMRRVFEGCR
jgi:hypothetical protein